jgi:rod shape-determining protein MreC
MLARIKSVTQSRLSKQIIINKGLNDAVTLSDLVIGSDGVVGQVTEVTALFATVKLLSDPTLHMPVKNSRTGARGITKGLASNEKGMVVEFIPLESDIKIGDIFVTSGIGNSYPSGYSVGRVKSVDESPNSSFMRVSIDPTQNMNQLELVLIVKEKND